MMLHISGAWINLATFCRGFLSLLVIHYSAADLTSTWNLWNVMKAFPCQSYFKRAKVFLVSCRNFGKGDFTTQVTILKIDILGPAVQNISGRRGVSLKLWEWFCISGGWELLKQEGKSHSNTWLFCRSVFDYMFEGWTHLEFRDPIDTMGRSEDGMKSLEFMKWETQRATIGDPCIEYH